jgi:two-component system response regulator
MDLSLFRFRRTRRENHKLEGYFGAWDCHEKIPHKFTLPNPLRPDDSIREDTVRRKAVLLVEDDPNDAELTLRELKDNIANEMVVCRNGSQAIQYLFLAASSPSREGSNLPEVILLDLNLPKIDGLEVLRRIRKDGRTKSLPVVVLTASNEDKDRIEAYGLGINAYIQKPITLMEFCAATRELGLLWLLTKVPPTSESLLRSQNEAPNRTKAQQVLSPAPQHQRRQHAEADQDTEQTKC